MSKFIALSSIISKKSSDEGKWYSCSGFYRDATDKEIDFAKKFGHGMIFSETTLRAIIVDTEENKTFVIVRMSDCDTPPDILQTCEKNIQASLALLSDAIKNNDVKQASLQTEGAMASYKFWSKVRTDNNPFLLAFRKAFDDTDPINELTMSFLSKTFIADLEFTKTELRKRFVWADNDKKTDIATVMTLINANYRIAYMQTIINLYQDSHNDYNYPSYVDKENVTYCQLFRKQVGCDKAKINMGRCESKYHEQPGTDERVVEIPAYTVRSDNLNDQLFSSYSAGMKICFSCLHHL